MSATPRELMLQTLSFASPCRVPQDLWVLPIAQKAHPMHVAAIREAYPSDIQSVSAYLAPPRTIGDPHSAGTYVDPWGCVFENIQDGVIGEVKQPQIQDWERDSASVRFPDGWLSPDVETLTRSCDASDRFTCVTPWVRPWEQLQFLRGSANMMRDLADPPAAMRDFIQRVHAFYCRMLENWMAVPVDAISIMDDWGSQRSLLISPDMWRNWFKPMYRDYCDIARSAGKKVLMHSDGYILDIFPDLIEIGVDAINAQIFCMGVERLAPFAGKITFWGEIDRQDLLPHAGTGEIRDAVHSVHRHLWRHGGCIAQCEFGAGANPENVRTVFDTWKEISDGL